MIRLSRRLWASFSITAFTFTASVALAQAPSDLIKRGEYLARAGDCVACHSLPGGAAFAGGLYMPTPFGDISVPNITPDEKTGIGGWTDNQFYRALHEGIGRKGEYLYPVFPFPWYTQVTRDDAMAIKAYLFSVPPQNAPRKPLKIGFPFNVREGLITWRTLFFKPQTFQPDPKLTPVQQRGQYLVEGLGHCGECHNAHNVLGASKWSGDLRGGAIEGWYAPNITSDDHQGVGGWTEADLVTFLRNGAAPGHGVVLGPMQETISESLHYLSDDDLHGIAAYLKSFPPAKNDADVKRTAFVSNQPAGSAAYLSNCAACHRLDGQGVANQVPALKGNGAVLAKGPENVIRVVLGGLPAGHGLAPMPAVGAGMSDQDVADAVDYVRNTWGNTSSNATGAGSVGDLRSKTQSLLAGNLPAGCGDIGQTQDSAVVDAATAQKLRQLNEGNILQEIDEILPALKRGSRDIDETTNAVTVAYCRLALSDPAIGSKERARALGNFTTQLWGQLTSNSTSR